MLLVKKISWHLHQRLTLSSFCRIVSSFVTILLKLKQEELRIKGKWCSVDPSSNPAEFYNFNLFKLYDKNENKCKKRPVLKLQMKRCPKKVRTLKCLSARRWAGLCRGTDRRVEKVVRRGSKIQLCKLLTQAIVELLGRYLDLINDLVTLFNRI